MLLFLVSRLLRFQQYYQLNLMPWRILIVSGKMTEHHLSVMDLRHLIAIPW